VFNDRAYTFALSHCRRFSALAWLALAILSYACSFTPSVDTAAAPCVQGRSERCACDNGTIGVSVCGADSAFGVCQCGAPSSGGSGGGLPVGGSAGEAGSGGGGDHSDDGVAASAGPDPVVDAGGSAGFAATGGMTGGDGGVMAGAGGTGVAGAAGDSTGGPGPMEEPPPGEEPYSACRDDGSCDLPMFCTFDASSDGVQRYCAPVCNGNGFGALSCPPRRDGGRGRCVRNFCMR